MTMNDAIAWMRNRHPRHIALATVDAVNRRDWAGLRKLLDEDFFYIESGSERIETASRFIAALRAMVTEVPDFTLEIDKAEEAGHMVYMHGRTMSEDFRFRSSAMWRSKIDHGRMLCLENFRFAETGQLSSYVPSPHNA